MKTEVRLVEGGHDLPHMGWGPVGCEGGVPWGVRVGLHGRVGSRGV
jgi:hypothetical protein